MKSAVGAPPACVHPVGQPLLRLQNVESAYGPIKAIRGVSLQVRRGEIAAVTSTGRMLRVSCVDIPVLQDFDGVPRLADGVPAADFLGLEKNETLVGLAPLTEVVGIGTAAGVVKRVNPDYPLIRFATGDLSAVMPGESPCGRTNMRIQGWMGRADQTAKIKGMFVRPEQVAGLVARHPEVSRARVIADRRDEMDVMVVQLETLGQDRALYEASVLETLKLKGRVELVAPGSLPNDGKVIEDRRSYG